MRPSRWYPEVRRSTVLPDITRVRSSIDNRNPGYQPVHRHVAIFHDRDYMAAIKAISKVGIVIEDIGAE